MEIPYWEEFVALWTDITYCYTAPDALRWKRTLRHTPFEVVYDAVYEYSEVCAPYLDQIMALADRTAFSSVCDLSYRLKTKASLALKWQRNQDNGRQLSSVCNDILGFRLVLDCSPVELAQFEWRPMTPKSRVVNFYTHPKQPDDGYRGIHLYFTGTSFPVEVQLWTRQDAILHFYSHEAIYKLRNSPEEQSYAVSLRQWMDQVPDAPQSLGENFLEYLYRFVLQYMGGSDDE
jgi:ppGpp synthetase/RelA/SpoT-type nucleotidyltranferase